MRRTTRQRVRNASPDRQDPKNGGHLGAVEGFQHEQPDDPRATQSQARPALYVPPDEEETAEYVCVR